MNNSQLDIAANRRARQYPRKEMFYRVVWVFGKILFRWSPRICFGWRRFILRCFGADVGNNVHIYNSAIIYFPWHFKIGDWSSVGEDALVYNLGPVVIGSKVTISHRSHLCAGTHDYNRADLPLLKPPIIVKDQAWICAGAFVGPNITIGHGAVVGACAVVIKNVEPWTIVGGNPAKFIKKRIMKEI
jgi:putative colanic acid biosynthesis acetyltransferase WcaF